MNKDIFIRLDADNVGDAIELSLINNDVHEANKIHQKIQLGINKLLEKLLENNTCVVLMQGCDDILFKMNYENYSLAFIQDLKDKFFMLTGYSVSVGVANSIQDVLINLKKAKLSGKNKIIESINISDG